MFGSHVHRVCVGTLAAAVFAGPAAGGIQAELLASNASLTIGLSKAVIEDPPKGDVITGSVICEWRDADQVTPGNYKHWTVDDLTDTGGNAEELFLLADGAGPARTNTLMASPTILVHVAGDSNDGRGEIYVDGSLVARLDLNVAGGADYAIVRVTNLPNTDHDIEVRDLGMTAQMGASGDDVAILGASAADCVGGTTVITHGFTFGGTGVNETWCGCDSASCSLQLCTVCNANVCGNPEPGAWTETMAKAVVARNGGDCDAAGPIGSVFFYDQSTTSWDTVCGSDDPAEETVFIFNWSQESDGLNQGGPYYFAQAAADALYAALRDPDFSSGSSSLDGFEPVATDRRVHLVGHSRGAVVNSVLAAQLSTAGIPIDQMTLLDPHPIDGDPDPITFQDAQAHVWKGAVSWADDYNRGDTCLMDPDGDPRGSDPPIPGTTDTDLTAILGDSSAFPCDGDPPLEHSEVHAWYHGTIDLGASSDGNGINIDRANWYSNDGVDEGYHYSAVGGGTPRPTPEPATLAALAPRVGIFNGGFEKSLGNLGHAGWDHHGGNPPSLGVWQTEIDPMTLKTNHYAALSSSESITHNRVYVDEIVHAIELRYRAPGAVVGNQIEVALLEPDGTLATTLEAGVESRLEWTDLRIPIPVANQGQSYALRFQLDGVFTADIDEAVFSAASAEVPALSARSLGLALFLLAAAGFLLARRAARG